MMVYNTCLIVITEIGAETIAQLVDSNESLLKQIEEKNNLLKEHEKEGTVIQQKMHL